jgi:hypothetical protein
MKEYKVWLLLLFFSFLHLSAQTDAHREAGDARIKKAHATEKEIERYIVQNIDGHKLSKATVSSLKKEMELDRCSSERLTQRKLQSAIIRTKKEELRKKFFKENPEKEAVFFYARPLVEEELIPLCANAGFEYNPGSFHFLGKVSANTNINGGCTITPGSLTGVSISASTNQFTAQASEITSVNEPFLYSNSLTVNTVNIGSNSVKLNPTDGNANANVTMMYRDFNNIQYDELSFSFLYIGDTGGVSSTHTPPFFRYRLIDVTNLMAPVELFSKCFDLVHGDCRFTYIEDYAYTGWMCERIDTEAYNGMDVRIEFTVGDCHAGNHFSTVYIDDVCEHTVGCEPVNEYCCKSEIELDDVLEWSVTKTYLSSDIITASNYFVADSDVSLTAAESVTILPDTHIAESDFLANIADCGIDNSRPYDIQITGTGFQTKKTETADGPTDMLVMPNPASGIVTVSANNRIIKNISLFSLVGKKVFTKDVSNKNSLEFDISNFDKGIYIITIETSDGTILKEKLIKN